MPERRTFLKKCAAWGGYALGALAVGFPVFSFLGFRKITEKTVTFPPDAQHGVANFKDGVYLMATKDGFKGLSAKCPHLGCTVNFDGVSRTFKCPCHGSTFNASGTLISGPALKNLQPLPVKKTPGGNMEVVIKI